MNRRCLELRAADTGCNFYLGAAIAISAGLDGVRRKVDPGEPAEFNTYDPEQQGEELPRRDVQPATAHTRGRYRGLRKGRAGQGDAGQGVPRDLCRLQVAGIKRLQPDGD